MESSHKIKKSFHAFLMIFVMDWKKKSTACYLCRNQISLLDWIGLDWIDWWVFPIKKHILQTFDESKVRVCSFFIIKLHVLQFLILLDFDQCKQYPMWARKEGHQKRRLVTIVQGPPSTHLSLQVDWLEARVSSCFPPMFFCSLPFIAIFLNFDTSKKCLL